MSCVEEDILADLARVFGLLRRRFDRAMMQQGASLAQTKMLLSIQADKGSARAADIAERLGLTPRTVTEALDALERDGMIQRLPDPADRRVKRLEITAAGEAAVAATEPLRREMTEELLDILDPEERAHLHQALRKLLQGLPAR